MSGIGDSLADLDKGVRKSVPGGWGTVAGLAAGGAGLYYGLGAGAAGAAGSAGASTLGAGTATGATAAGSAGAINSTAAALGGAGGGGAFIPAAGSGASFGLVPGASYAAAGMPITDASLGYSGAAKELGLEGSRSGLTDLSGKQGSAMLESMGLNSKGFSISPMQALLMSRMVGGQQQPQGGQQTSVGMKQGQAPNVSDPIMALLAPKMKKKERISLL